MSHSGAQPPTGKPLREGQYKSDRHTGWLWLLDSALHGAGKFNVEQTSFIDLTGSVQCLESLTAAASEGLKRVP